MIAAGSKTYPRKWSNISCLAYTKLHVAKATLFAISKLTSHAYMNSSRTFKYSVDILLVGGTTRTHNVLLQNVLDLIQCFVA